MTLQQAITEIEKRHFAYQLPLQKIEYQHGSETSFVYRLNGEMKNRFINLENPSGTKFTERVYQRTKALKESWRNQP